MKEATAKKETVFILIGAVTGGLFQFVFEGIFEIYDKYLLLNKNPELIFVLRLSILFIFIAFCYFLGHTLDEQISDQTKKKSNKFRNFCTIIATAIVALKLISWLLLS